MILGQVNERLEIIVRLAIANELHQVIEVVAMLDTGFTGSLTLPNSLITKLSLSWLTRSTAVLADGSFHCFDAYSAFVIWDGSPRHVVAQATDSIPLIGTALIAHHDLRVRLVSGGTVEIEKIAQANP